MRFIVIERTDNHPKVLQGKEKLIAKIPDGSEIPPGLIIGKNTKLYTEEVDSNE